MVTSDHQQTVHTTPLLSFSAPSSTCLAETLFAIVTMIFGVIFYSYVIGIMNQITRNMDNKENALQTKIQFMTEYCNNLGLGKKIRYKMRSILEDNIQKNAFMWC